MKNIIILALLAIFAISCSENSTEPKKDEIRLSATQPDWLVPISVGNKWVYRNTNSEVIEYASIQEYNTTVEILADEGMFDWIESGRDGSYRTFKMEETGLPWFQDYPVYEFQGFIWSSITNVRADKNYYQVAEYGYPVKKAAWSVDIDDPNAIFHKNYKMTRRESIYVQGKLYEDCYVFEAIYFDDYVNVNYYTKYHFKKGIGIVRHEFYYVPVGSTEKEYYNTKELVSYSLK